MSGISSGHRVPPSFVVDNKKNEVNELKQLLKQIMTERDQNKRRDAIKKVIAYMTLGIDVSKLFTDMVMISSTTDIVQKKMIYLFLINYASDSGDQALMAINTFLKDCKRTNPDAKIRGLALRCLCSLRFTGAFEYQQPAIQEGLEDPDPYVRRTSIIGMIKLFYSSPGLVKEPQNINTLYGLIRDPDATVSCNAILALNEILYDDGGIAINRRMVIYLLNRIQQYTEFAQSIIFDIVSKYTPQDDEELFDILNILEDRLKHASSSVVLGCIKVFLNYTQGKEAILPQVYNRIQAPLLTLFLGGSVSGAYELSYTVLCHIHLLVSRGANTMFENEYKHFFCKYDEPTYIKFLKVEILTLIATENSLQDIINELSEYVTDVDVGIARSAIKAIGKIALRIPNASSAIIYQLLNFLKLNIDYVLTGTLIVMKDILRKYRQQSTEILQAIEGNLESVESDEGKSAVIWMIGEFGEQIDDAPYILEYFINNYSESLSLNVQMALLTSAVKLFLKRAPEMQQALGLLFQNIFTNKSNPDLVDRAGYYYKILQLGPEQAYDIINTEKHAIINFVEDDKQTYSDRIIQEFNTLSVLYQKPSEKFIKKREQLLPPEEEVVQPMHKAEPTADINLLGLEEIPAVQYEEPQIELFRLLQSPTMDTSEFQQMWMSLEEDARQNRMIRVGLISTQQIEDLLSSSNIMCIASGQQDAVLKFYFYARAQTDQSALLMEMIINLGTSEMTYTIKSQNVQYVGDFLNILQNTMTPILA